VIDQSRGRHFASAIGVCIVIQFASSTSFAAGETAPGSAAVAEVEGEKITAEQLDKSIAVELTGLEEQIYRLRRQKLDAMIDERLLANEAARQKISVGELVDKEVTAKTALVTELEIDTFYQANKDRIRESPDIRQQIRQYLQNQRLAAEREKYLQTLRTKANVAINLPRPPAVRVDVGTSSSLPIRGG
jgi:hypothetical protein